MMAALPVTAVSFRKEKRRKQLRPYALKSAKGALRGGLVT
jgi:hypothetical protein